MSDRFTSVENQKPDDAKAPESHGWLTDHVWYPFVRGSGVLQIAGNFTPDRIELPKTPGPSNAAEWGVETLSSVAGAAAPYLIAERLASKATREIGNLMEARGAFARILASDHLGQIAGPVLYDTAKRPEENETRTGNFTGSLVGFGTYVGGNALSGRATGLVSNAVMRFGLNAVSKVGVGFMGGAASYEAANQVSNYFGMHNDISLDGALQAGASGAFINSALPAAHFGLNKLSDKLGFTIPVGRLINSAGIKDPDITQMARDNPPAGVQKGAAGTVHDGALIKRNIVTIKEGDDAARLGHELYHLELARKYEPEYQRIGKLVTAKDPSAEQEFYKLRGTIESEARQMENQITARSTNEKPRPTASLDQISGQIASNGITYRDIWRNEFDQFAANPSKYRPTIEHAQADTKESAAVLGWPDQLGAHFDGKGVNFALAAETAQAVELYRWSKDDPNGKPEVLPLFKTETLPLFKEGAVWHRYVEGAKPGDQYGFRVVGPYDPEKGERFNDNKLIQDPYARATTGEVDRDTSLGYDNSDRKDPNRFGRKSEVKNLETAPRAVVIDSNDFDWGRDKAPNIPMKRSFIYEVNLRAFTAKDDALGEKKGSFLGLIEEIPHLKRMGYTAIELLPIFEFDQNEYIFRDPVTGLPNFQDWGYNTVGYQAPEGKFAVNGRLGQQVNEFKQMVKALHDNDLELILDVVFNHTREGGEDGPTINFKGVGNREYYLLQNQKPFYVDHTGTGNTFNANSPQGMQLVLDTLRYWVKDMHVDGFRFDLASAFKYDENNHSKAKTPVIAAIERDPILREVKLIAEPWAIDRYDLGQFSEHTWAEWNGSYRDVARRFLIGKDGQVNALADRITGSPSWFKRSMGRESINFINCHDGMTLRDWVSYNEKQNSRNGEGGRDGSPDNNSWDSGGDEKLRERQSKNALSLLMVSRGTPMILYGDEMGRSQQGNNNTWSKGELNDLDWTLAQKNEGLVRFLSELSKLRNEFKIGESHENDFWWHGVEPDKPDWGTDAHFIAFELKPQEPGGKRLYVALNSYWEPLNVKLPKGNWSRRIDTNLPAGQDIVGSDKAQKFGQNASYVVQPRTFTLFESP